MIRGAVSMSEADLQRQVVELAQLFGWRVAHFRPARERGGWRTPVAADGKGFPDLVLVRDDRLLIVELKSARGRLTADQQAWIDAFSRAGVDTRVWRPNDWDEIETTLTQRGDR